MRNEKGAEEPPRLLGIIRRYRNNPNWRKEQALVGRWLSRLDRRLFCPLLLTHASLSGCGLLSTLVSQLGKRPAFRQETNLAAIQAALADLGKVVPLIIIDEALKRLAVTNAAELGPGGRYGRV